jgi:hypothetical protein
VPALHLAIAQPDPLFERSSWASAPGFNSKVCRSASSASTSASAPLISMLASASRSSALVGFDLSISAMMAAIFLNTDVSFDVSTMRSAGRSFITNVVKVGTGRCRIW